MRALRQFTKAGISKRLTPSAPHDKILPQVNTRFSASYWFAGWYYFTESACWRVVP
jgi:hypothetical protein